MRRALFAGLVLAARLHAQPAPAPIEHRVDGRVVLLGGPAPAGVPNAWVTLHRVAQDSSGPLDSLQTNATGVFSFRFRPFGSEEAIYFVSTRRGGVAYFTRPLRDAVVRGEDAEISVYDTTSAHVPITVRGRHLIVSAADANDVRSVIEVFELSNDSSHTAIEREGAAAGVWSIAVPKGAQRFEVRAGEIPSDALVLTSGRAVLHLPLAPGIKQLAFSYALRGDDFPIAIQAEGPTSVLEVLLEDARGTATGSALTAVEPVLVEGRSFRRFLAQDIPVGGRVTVDVPASRPNWVHWIVPGVLVVVGVGMVGALAWSRRSVVPRPTVATSAPLSDVGSLAQQIAVLDEAFDARHRAVPASDAERETHLRDRAALKTRLAEAMSKRTVGA